MPTVTEPVYDIRTGQQTGTITVDVLTPAEALSATQEGVAKEAYARTLGDQLDQALALLRTERDRPYGGMTANQAIGALVDSNDLLCQVCIGLVRLVRDRYDGAD